MSPVFLSGLSWVRPAAGGPRRPEPPRKKHTMMKLTFLILLAAVLAALASGLSSCSSLAGTTLTIGEKGVTITPPATPIVITK